MGNTPTLLANPNPNGIDPTADPDQIANTYQQAQQQAAAATLAGLQQQGQPALVQDTPGTGDIPQQQGPDPNLDLEIRAAGVHHWRLADSLGTAAHAILDTLGGTDSYTIAKDANGNPTITKGAATTGEKWGRIAAGLLSGAAKGFAAGQGPGGAARAGAAGFDQGVQARQQPQQQAQQELGEAQKTATFNANMARLHQQIVQGAWDNAHLDRDDLQAQEDRSIKHSKEMTDAGITPIAMGVKDPQALAQYGITNPAAVDWHMGKDGNMIYAEPDGKGGVNLYHLTPDQANMPTTEPESAEMIITDPKDPTKTISKPFAMPIGEKWKDRVARRMALNTANDNVLKNAAAAKVAKQEADTKQSTQEDNARKTDSEISRNRAAAGASSAEASLHNAQATVLRGAGSAGSAAATGLKGEEYLKASGIDPGAWNQIKAAANGDVKMPSASRSPQNQAFRNAVMNYDPTFTDSRYDTKQNFKTKGDSQSVVQLATAMDHAERALANSAKLGNSVSLLTGRDLSGPAADYNEDVNLFSGEMGKLIKNGVVTGEEADRYRKGISSPVQSIRDSALAEALHLTGGKVGALFQKYKTGTGQDLPVNQFFDQPTQQRLQHFGAAPQQSQNGAAATPPPQSQPGQQNQGGGAGATFKAAPTQPPNPPYPGAVFGTGPSGPGWYPGPGPGGGQ